MCGICGIFNQVGYHIDRNTLESMTKAIEHRGPDGEGHYVNDEIGLGHRRLSIIDLEGGAQPISNEDDTLQIVFNGEIYNFIEMRKQLEDAGHRFKTRSDTEVIIHAYEQWGTESVGRLNGMFAFALWNSRQHELVLARDHLGIKPLYYTVVKDQFLFASEIKALLKHPECLREVDLEALAELFTFRYVPSPKTLFKGIFKLPAGHMIRVKGKKIDIMRYWNWVPELRKNWCEKELIEDYRSLLEDTVRLQLRSDVPLGLFLSSGIDSGVLLALMSNYSSSPVKTFTIGFKDGEKTNEVEDAKRIALRFGAEHYHMILEPDDYALYYKRYMSDLEEPVGHEAAAAFYFLSKMTSQYVKVALTGQGADEPWAGYHRHIGVKLSTFYSSLPNFITKLLALLVTKTPFPNERLKRGVVALCETDILTRFAKIYSFFNKDMKALLYKGSLKKNFLIADYYATKKALMRSLEDVSHLDPLSQILYIDTRTNLPDDLLMVADKTSMANSLEVRVPFLDYRLIEFIETVPPNLKLKGLTGKYLHKKAIEKWLTKHEVHRVKKGFDNPLEKWFRISLRAIVEEYLLSSDSATAIYFDQDYIRHMLKIDREGKEQLRRHINLLMSFEMWHREFIKT